MNLPTLRHTQSRSSANLVVLPMSPSKHPKIMPLPSTIGKNGIINNIKATKKQELDDASTCLNCFIDQKNSNALLICSGLCKTKTSLRETKN